MKLRDQLEQEAAHYNIIVEDTHKGVQLIAPDGFCFDTDLHGLVSSQWDHEPMPNVLRSAIQDVRTYGPRMQKCPDNCSCKE